MDKIPFPITLTSRTPDKKLDPVTYETNDTRDLGQQIVSHLEGLGFKNIVLKRVAIRAFAATVD